MNIKKITKDKTKEYLQAMEKIDKEIEAIKADKAIYSAEHYDELIEDLKDKKSRCIVNARDELQQIRDSYINSVKDKYSPKGAELTEDAAILTSGLNLSGDELNALYDKYNGNNTMQRLIYEHGVKTETKGFYRRYRGMEAERELVENMERYERNVFSRPAMFEDFNNMYDMN